MIGMDVQRDVGAYLTNLMKAELTHFLGREEYERNQGGGRTTATAAIAGTSAMNRWDISEISLQTDHFHLIMWIKPSDSVSGVVQIVKGGTSRALRKEFPGLEEFLWGDSFWADGYSAESIGHVDKDIVRRYIREQRGRS